jgi:molecular chaperone DnaK (HSP70)
VVKGAAIWAHYKGNQAKPEAMMSDEVEAETTEKKNDSETNKEKSSTKKHAQIKNAPTMCQVTPKSTGIALLGDRYSVLVKGDTEYPVKKSDIYETVCDNQTMINVEVAEGGDETFSKNLFIDSFYIRGLPPLPKGQAKVEVTFEIDANGILKVTAVDTSNRTNTASKIMQLLSITQSTSLQERKLVL